jgi:hypothetical protein
VIVKGVALATSVHPVGGTRAMASSDELFLTVLHGVLTNSPSASRWPLDVVMLCRNSEAPSTLWASVVSAAIEARVGPVRAEALAMCRTELDAGVADASSSADRAGCGKQRQSVGSCGWPNGIVPASGPSSTAVLTGFVRSSLTGPGRNNQARVLAIASRMSRASSARVGPR